MAEFQMLLSEINITAAKEKQFISKGITTVEELQNFFPIGYRDYREVTPISQVISGGYYLIYGKITGMYAGDKVSSVYVRDNSGETIRIDWFGKPWIFKRLTKGEEYYFGGKVDFYNGNPNINSPEIATKVKSAAIQIKPRYSVINGMSDEYLRNKIEVALEQEIETLPEQDELAQKLGLMERREAFKAIHFPPDRKTFKGARMRLASDDLYTLFSELKAKESGECKGFMEIKSVEKAFELVRNLPYKLTAGQKTVLGKIKNALLSGNRLNSLLLGDVGSGKTLVAIIAAMIAVENGYQVAFLSPTQILASQTFNEVEKYLNPFGVKVGFINGKMKAKEKREVLKKTTDGTYQILVGTHSILSDNVQFDRLGLFIIDEEHRFGVAQKNALKSKAEAGISTLSMSATPIPRSLALTLYGKGNEVLMMETAPTGRKPVITQVKTRLSETYQMIRQEIAAGHQCYVVCPLVAESESEAMGNVSSAEELEKELKKEFSAEGINVGVITGAMKAQDVQETLERFTNNEIQILVATTIVEVGVNVPNSTVMIIKNAERFGLAQLHQLRGRVGRSSLQSYCYLVSDMETERLNVLCQTTNGFEIAEQDMNFRGAGELVGELQSGYSKEVETIMKYPKLAAKVKEYVFS